MYEWKDIVNLVVDRFQLKESCKLTVGIFRIS